MSQLAGEKVTLAPLSMADVSSEYVGWLNDPEINCFMDVRFYRQTRATARRYLESFRDAGNGRYIWGIYDPDCPLVGTITCTDVNQDQQRCYIGLMIGRKDCWGKGYGTDAIRLVTAYAFNELGMHKCCAGVVAENRGALRSFEKAGYLVEGVLLEHDCYKGIFRDALLLGRINN